MTTDTLMPCPFCGGRAVRIIDELAEIADHLLATRPAVAGTEEHYQCVVCLARSGPSRHPVGAVENWNMRRPFRVTGPSLNAGVPRDDQARA